MRKKNLRPEQVAADAVEITTGEGLSERNVKNLRKLGINTTGLPEEVVNMSFISHGQIWHGVAIENTAGGYSFYTASGVPHCIHLGQTGLIVLPCEGKKPEATCIFVNIVDYMVFASKAGKSDEHDFRHCDCFIVEKPTLFLDCLRQVSSYDRIYCLFPPSDSTETMYLTLREYFNGRSPEKKIELWNTKRKAPKEAIPSTDI